MADYTDGLGWAKLDTTAACHLGRIIENFSDKTRGARATMLLFCYSQIREAKVPYFRLGVRTIAKACGYSPKKAQQFLEYCEEREYFVTVESAKDGKTPKRTFWWLADEVYQIQSIRGRKALKATFPPPLPLSPLTLRRKRVR